jgi:uncharacterized protein
MEKTPVSPKETPDVSQLAAKCRSADDDACHKLADAVKVWDPSGSVLSPAKASEVYSVACAKGSKEGCRLLALTLKEGDSKDQSRAARLLTKDCTAGFQSSCVTLGWQYKDGLGVPKDPSQTLLLWTRACEGKGNPCFLVGFGYQKGWFGSAPDFGQAASWYEKSCEAGNGGACVNLGSMYEHGNGVEKSTDTAIRIQRKGCQLGEGMGCKNLAYLLGEPCRGLLQERGCQLGDDGSCARLAESARKSSPPDQVSSVQYDIRGCKLGSGASCQNVGIAYDLRKGVDEQNLALAATYYGRACDLGFGGGCLGLGVLIERGAAGSHELADALALYRKSCDLKLEQGCQQLTRASLNAVPLPASRVEKSAGVTLSSVRIQTNDAADSEQKRSLRIQVDATAQKAVSDRSAIRVKATCAVGTKRLVDDAMDLLGRPGAPLGPGETKTLDFAPFINDGLEHDPSRCELTFFVAMGFGVGTAARTYCWSPGIPPQEGSCPW